MIDLLREPWPWWIVGPGIALLYIFLYLFGERFGISSVLKTSCSIVGAGKFSDFFKYDWKRDTWNLFFVFGAVLGGYISSTYFSNGGEVELSQGTIQTLNSLSIEQGTGLAPVSLFGTEDIGIQKLLFWVMGGFLVGFGTRYAGGCTSGHAISGLSNLQLPSLVAVCGFFIGGLLMIHFMLEPILNWVL